MSDPKSTTTNWAAAWEALRALDDDAWDAENERLNDLWEAEYRAEFVRYALTRNWDQENAEVWCNEIHGDALSSSRGTDLTPKEVAQGDVHECEWETHNAV